MTIPLLDATTVASQVLASDWEYLDADTRYLTHNIHRYSGKFIPQIAGRAVELLTRPGDVVLDVYCGSGTTLVECALRGRTGIGVDLSPLAILIARVKTTPVAQRRLRSMISSLRHALSISEGTASLPLFESLSQARSDDCATDARLTHPWFVKWFQPQVLSDLLRIDQAIRALPDSDLRAAAQVAFSNILRRSSNAHSGYPNVMFDRSAPSKPRPIGPFLREIVRVASMVSELGQSAARWNDVSLIHGSATALPVAHDSVDAIITHPPYIGSIPYAEYGALSLQWLGTDPKELDRALTGGRRQSRDVVDRFAHGYSTMLKESARVLKRGRFAFLMVGNPLVKGETVDLASMTRRFAAQAGLELVADTVRRGVNRRANKMGAEHLLFFQKT